MSRRKEPVIPAELLDRLLAGTDAAAALDCSATIWMRVWRQSG